MARTGAQSPQDEDHIVRRGLAFLALLLAAGPAAAEQPAPARRAEILFASHGGVFDWRAEGENAIVIESRDHRYYRATFLYPCYGLQFRTRVGFVTDARDILDKFDAVRVGDRTCSFVSFDEIPKPEKW